MSSSGSNSEIAEIAAIVASDTQMLTTGIAPPSPPFSRMTQDMLDALMASTPSNTPPDEPAPLMEEKHDHVDEQAEIKMKDLLQKPSASQVLSLWRIILRDDSGIVSKVSRDEKQLRKKVLKNKIAINDLLAEWDNVIAEAKKDPVFLTTVRNFFGLSSENELPDQNMIASIGYLWVIFILYKLDLSPSPELIKEQRKKINNEINALLSFRIFNDSLFSKIQKNIIDPLHNELVRVERFEGDARVKPLGETLDQIVKIALKAQKDYIDSMLIQRKVNIMKYFLQETEVVIRENLLNNTQPLNYHRHSLTKLAQHFINLILFFSLGCLVKRAFFTSTFFVSLETHSHQVALGLDRKLQELKSPTVKKKM